MGERNCYKCVSKVWNSQCGYNGSGIGNGEQAASCVDFARTQFGRWLRSIRTKRHSIDEGWVIRYVLRLIKGNRVTTSN